DEAANPATCRIAAIESREEAAFLAAAKEIGLVPEAVKRVDGLNINGGDDVDIGLYEKSVPTTVSEDGNEQQQ
ncbi:MAG: glycosyltransferase family 39 protein, partial [Pseudomonadota bacterium]|nr:glycosyltransferase family 39 protein [Pseudomonadota bacterium]